MVIAMSITGTDAARDTGSDTVRRWAKLTALLVVTPAAAFGSFTGLRGLGLRCGWGDAAPLLPVALDGWAAYAVLWWLSAVSVSKRRQARAHAWCAITASAAGNAVERYLTADLLATHWLIVVATGAAPALVFGAVCHLAARADVDADTGGLNAGGVAETPGILDEDADKPRARAKTVTPAGRRTDADLLAEIRARRLGDASADRLVAALSVGKPRAVRLRKLLAAELVPASGNGRSP
jgi:hypothetical protein